MTYNHTSLASLRSLFLELREIEKLHWKWLWMLKNNSGEFSKQFVYQKFGRTLLEQNSTLLPLLLALGEEGLKAVEALKNADEAFRKRDSMTKWSEHEPDWWVDWSQSNRDVVQALTSFDKALLPFLKKE